VHLGREKKGGCGSKKKVLGGKIEMGMHGKGKGKPRQKTKNKPCRKKSRMEQKGREAVNSWGRCRY